MQLFTQTPPGTISVEKLTDLAFIAQNTTATIVIEAIDTNAKTSPIHSTTGGADVGALSLTITTGITLAAALTAANYALDGGAAGLYVYVASGAIVWNTGAAALNNSTGAPVGETVYPIAAGPRFGLQGDLLQFGKYLG